MNGEIYACDHHNSSSNCSMIAKMIQTTQPEIVSRLLVKPSSTTPPNHPEVYTFSVFDQLSPRIYAPLIYFYTEETGQGLDSIAHKSSLLRTSLSRILSQYYPLAGRMRDDHVSIDCNDEGVVFLEARIGLELSEFLNNPREEIVQVFFPDGLQYKDASLSSPLVVQVTFFDCGGIAIAVCISHKIMDMASLCCFINDWAATTRESGKEIAPELNLGTLYPPLNQRLNQPPVTGQTSVSTVSTRLVFSDSKLAKLKAVVAQEVENPTRVELMTAIICKTAVSAARANSGIQKPFTLVQAVNLRKMVCPPLTENHVGNFVGAFTVATITEQNKEVDLKWLVREMRRQKTEYLADCNRTSAREELCLLFLEQGKKRRELCSRTNCEVYVSSSWCRFPIYEADFGWGKPRWVTTASSMAKNMIMMMDTRDGDGIEVVITLEKQDMAFFERDEKLLAFSTINPSRY